MHAHHVKKGTRVCWTAIVCFILLLLLFIAADREPMLIRKMRGTCDLKCICYDSNARREMWCFQKVEEKQTKKTPNIRCTQCQVQVKVKQSLVVHFTCGNIFITQRIQHILLTGILHLFDLFVCVFFTFLVHKMRAIAINQRNSRYWPRVCVFVLLFCTFFFNVHSFIVCLFRSGI